MTLTPEMQQWESGQQMPEKVVNENFVSLQHQAVYAMNPETTSLLTWGYIGGRWGGFEVATGTLSLTGSASNYVVVDRSDGSISVSTSDTNWNNTSSYARVFLITTGPSTVTDTEDYRAGPNGVHGSASGGGGGGASTTQTGEAFGGFIASPSDKDYRIGLKMPHGGTITETTTRSVSGTCTATFKINSTALGGTANSVSTSEQSQSHASNNVFSAGDDIVLTISSNSSCSDMSFMIKYTRTLE